MDEQTLQIRRLSALLEVSQALGSTLDMGEAFEKTLETLDRELGLKRGAIALLGERLGGTEILAAVLMAVGVVTFQAGRTA